jgi:hypothetical protein
MADLSVQNPNEAGIAGSLVAAASGGDAFVPGGRTWVELVNGSGGAITVNFALFADGLTIAAGRSVSIPAGARRLIQLKNIGVYTDPADGKVKMTYSGVTSLTVGVFAL